jgi:hypothetical protein
MPPPPFSPLFFLSELVYTIVILILCLLIYFKTKEIYELTKHKGIWFFRYSFLFFGLAYFSRLILYIMIMAGNFFMSESFGHRLQILPLLNLVTAYFSTMAILYLTYTTIWKKVSIESFLIVSNIISIVIATVAFIFISPFIVSLIQLLLLIPTIIISINSKEKKEKKTHTTYTKTLFFLITSFWLISLFIVNNPHNPIPYWINILLELISLVIFFAIYYKVIKWVK